MKVVAVVVIRIGEVAMELAVTAAMEVLTMEVVMEVL